VPTLITGGAGFIGSHLADALLESGETVRVLDSLDDQVHAGAAPSYLSPDVELRVGDVRDRDAVRDALDGVDVVVHFAAAVGVGQSMYEIERYTSVNALGAAVVLEEVAARRDRIRKVLVASSMSIYGEGRYRCPNHGPLAPETRSDEQLDARRWELACPHCDAPLEPLPTDEDKPIKPMSIYAIGKRDHEEMFLAVGQAYGIPVVALRYFNVYGPRQALSNPYTGVLAIFAARLLNAKPPLVFEDGLQRRDFVSVSDVARACRLALESERANGQVINIGTGRSVTVLEVAQKLARVLERNVEPFLTRRYRVGDIRHCFADVSRARELLGYEPQIELEPGMADLAEWLVGQVAHDRVEYASAELAARGLTR
jgi:dTDP-L-rhamnose 4-epimerase